MNILSSAQTTFQLKKPPQNFPQPNIYQVPFELTIIYTRRHIINLRILTIHKARVHQLHKKKKKSFIANDPQIIIKYAEIPRS